MRPDHTLTNEIRTVMENPTPIPELENTLFIHITFTRVPILHV